MEREIRRLVMEMFSIDDQPRSLSVQYRLPAMCEVTALGRWKVSCFWVWLGTWREESPLASGFGHGIDCCTIIIRRVKNHAIETQSNE